jgi:hypothetical protein
VTQPTEGGTAAAAHPGAAGPASPVLTGESRLEMADLTIVEQDNMYIVGDPALGTFVQLPPIGVTAIAHLRAGESVAEVAAALRTAEQDRASGDAAVDILDFASTLRELGFVTAIDGISTSSDGARPGGGSSVGPGWLARRWIAGPRPAKISWLFSKPAWVLYVLLFSGCAAIEIVSPSYRPHPGDFFFLSEPLASIAILTVVSFATVGGHECFHWLAGSAEGVSARFAISRRLYFLVFETDLTQLWSVPRWLNQIEIFFSVIQKKAVSPNDFASLDQLSETLLAFISRYNQTAKPFNWKYTADNLKDLLHRISEHDKQDTMQQTSLTRAA